MNNASKHNLADSSGRILFDPLVVADSFWARAIGMLRYAEIAPTFAMLLPQCRAVHTFLMRFPIDIAFLSNDYRVVEVYPEVQAGRLITNRNRNGTHTLEAASGAFHSVNLKHNDLLQIHEN